MNHPIDWSSNELHKWLKVYEGGKFSILKNQLLNVTGKQLTLYNDKQWAQLEPKDLAISFQHEFRRMIQVHDGNTTEYTEEDADIVTPLIEHNKQKVNAAPFPPLIGLPGPFLSFFLIMFIVFTILCLTMLKDDLYKIGISSPDLIRYGSIPVISTIFTYFHIWLALYLTFYPLKYIGCCRFKNTNVGCIGWEGIVPFKAEKMARLSVNIMTTQLLDVKEIFKKLDPEEVTSILEPLLSNTIRDIIENMALKYNKTLWDVLPLKIKFEIIEKVKEETPKHINSLMNEIRENIENIFDIEDMVVTNLLKDKQLLVNMFLTCGYKELVFIRDAGAYMGALFGIIQMGIWFFYSNKIVVFPLLGLLVGILTNYIALKMIFEPVNPKKICNIYVLQGLFLKRQYEVAAEYGKMVASDILNSKNIIESILRGPASDKLFELVYDNVQIAVNSGAAVTDKIVSLSIGKEIYSNIKEDITNLIVEKFPDGLRQIENYATKALDLEITIRDKMRKLTSQQFEQLLHPVFQEDEWKLIVMGGLLGLFIGFLQAFGINM